MLMVIVLILNGNSESVVNAWRKKVFFKNKKTDL